MNFYGKRNYFEFFFSDFFEFRRLKVDRFFVQTSDRAADFPGKNRKPRKIPQAAFNDNFVREFFEFAEIFRADNFLFGDGDFFSRADNFHGLRAVCNFRQNFTSLRDSRSRGDDSFKLADF